MKNPTLSDVLDAVNATRTDLSDKIDGLTRGQNEHGVAIHELHSDVNEMRTIVNGHSATLHEHSRALDRIERRQRAETTSLDDHERRITVMEKRATKRGRGQSGTAPA